VSYATTPLDAPSDALAKKKWRKLNGQNRLTDAHIIGMIKEREAGLSKAEQWLSP